MANLNIRNLSDKTYRKIKESAKRNMRSINNEIICLITEYLDKHDSQKSTNFLTLEKAMTFIKKKKTKI